MFAMEDAILKGASLSLHLKDREGIGQYVAERGARRRGDLLRSGKLGPRPDIVVGPCPGAGPSQVEEGDNFRFLEYWIASRDSNPSPTPPPASASERTSALLARVRLRSATPSGVADLGAARASYSFEGG